MTGIGPGGRRGQLVLLAAAVLAVALVPVALAYLQLGYHGDVDAASTDDAVLRDGERTLDHALHDAVDGIPERHPWSNRTEAVTEVRHRLRDDLSALNQSGVKSGTAYAVSYNHSRAIAWADENCPSGPARKFGSCRADRGVVVQSRANQTHVLAVTFDLRVTTSDGHWRATSTVRVGR
ncbi:MAG: hypothetical protein V5A39_14090 [Haloarculaceae archaeon]